MDINSYNRTFAALLQQMLLKSGKALARTTGLSESTVSRFQHAHLDTAVRVIVALGYRLVPVAGDQADGDYVRWLESRVAKLTQRVEQLEGER